MDWKAGGCMGKEGRSVELDGEEGEGSCKMSSRSRSEIKRQRRIGSGASSAN